LSSDPDTDQPEFPDPDPPEKKKINKYLAEPGSPTLMGADSSTI
jgi:hypothetical protein